MRYVTVRTNGSTAAGRLEGDEIVLLDVPDVGDLLRAGPDEVDETGQTLAAAEADLAPLIPKPDKILCVGRNYRDHAAEMAVDLPEYPTYFPKFARTLVGPRDDITLPRPEISSRVDWEGELAVVIGHPVRHATPAEALEAIAGFTICNDVSMRDWQSRTSQFLPGKTFEATAPLGPALVTRDEVGDGLGLALRTEVDGVTKQDGNTGDMVFAPVDIVADLSTVFTLDPGDIIATGTPSGVGHARDPREYLTDGSVVRVSVEGLGEIVNRCVVEAPH